MGVHPAGQPAYLRPDHPSASSGLGRDPARPTDILAHVCPSCPQPDVSRDNVWPTQHKPIIRVKKTPLTLDFDPALKRLLKLKSVHFKRQVA